MFQSAENPFARSTLYVLWEGRPPAFQLDLSGGQPVYLQAPSADAVGGEAPNEEKGLITEQADAIAEKTDGEVLLGTEMVEELENRPPRLLGVWTSEEALKKGRAWITRFAAACGKPTVLNGVELPVQIAYDYARNPPAAARPVVGVLVDFDGVNGQPYRIEGEPDGNTIRPAMRPT
tara:strand:+ start:46 stop:576 length:531 start_codon:yes stop_codon:yes gene_type:complete